MKTVVVEVVGFSDHPCGPFPCSEERTCGLKACAPSEELARACDALRDALHSEFGERIRVIFTSLDDGVPERIRNIVEVHHPPLPIILVNGDVTPIGRISLPLIRREIVRRL